MGVNDSWKYNLIAIGGIGAITYYLGMVTEAHVRVLLTMFGLWIAYVMGWGRGQQGKV